MFNLKKVILLSTSSLTWYGLHRIFSFAKNAWFDGIDLSVSKFNHDSWDEEYIQSLSKTFSLPVLSITAPGNWINEEKVDKIISMAKTLNSQIVNFSPPHFSDSSITWYTKYLPKVKKDTMIGICIKTVEPKFLFFIIPKYKKASLLEIKKITWDTSLELWAIESSSGIDIIRAQAALWSSIKNVYLSDRLWPQKWLLPWQAGWWISHLPIESFFMKLKATWYSWFISLEVKPSEIWVWTEQKVIQNLEYAINYYKKYFLDYK